MQHGNTTPPQCLGVHIDFHGTSRWGRVRSALLSAVRVHLALTLFGFLRGRFSGFVPFLRVLWFFRWRPFLPPPLRTSVFEPHLRDRERAHFERVCVATDAEHGHSSATPGSVSGPLFLIYCFQWITITITMVMMMMMIIVLLLLLLLFCFCFEAVLLAAHCR